MLLVSVAIGVALWAGQFFGKGIGGQQNQAQIPDAGSHGKQIERADTHAAADAEKQKPPAPESTKDKQKPGDPTSRQPAVFNPTDLGETRKWLGDRYEVFAKGYFSGNGLLQQEATEQLQRELKPLVGRKIRWPVTVLQVRPTYATLCDRSEKLNGLYDFYLSLWAIDRLPSGGDSLDEMKSAHISLADIGRDRFVALKPFDTAVILEGTIQDAEISTEGDANVACGIRLTICGCKASLLEP